jgi:mono/diheme cytochrome c family protein
LIRFTAACGPLIYRGDQFPADYSQNAFVCEPQANLVKRDILTFRGLKTTAVQAWDDKEFIASTDEGFRPVNLMNGPDGAMYVVDMHRGVMQHRTSETPYYREKIVRSKLDTLLHKGRILRIKYKNKKLDKVPKFNDLSDTQLVALLKSKNGWIRDRAQQFLIYKQKTSAVPQLKKLAQNNNGVAAIHALHTLDGLDALSFELLQKAAASGTPMLSAHALLLLKKYNSDDHIEAMKKLVTHLRSRNDTTIDLYLAASLGPWIASSPDTFLQPLVNLSHKYQGSTVFQEAVVSSLKGKEKRFRTYAMQKGGSKSLGKTINTLLDQTIKNKQEDKKNSIFVQRKIPAGKLAKGLLFFRSNCARCHGADGEGIEHLGPPLNGSEYVTGSTKRLAMIILNGLKGPIHVKGKRYSFNGNMPSFRDEYSDEELAGIIDYLHNSFIHADPNLSYGRKHVSPEVIKEIRKIKSGTLTEKDLLNMTDSTN